MSRRTLANHEPTGSSHCILFNVILSTTAGFFCHKTAFDIPGAKKVTFFSRILN